MSTKRRRATGTLAALAVAATTVVAPASLGAPAFGPGNNGGGEGNSGPSVGKCHPPGQTTFTPGCK